MFVKLTTAERCVCSLTVRAGTHSAAVPGLRLDLACRFHYQTSELGIWHIRYSSPTPSWDESTIVGQKHLRLHLPSDEAFSLRMTALGIA